MHETNENGPVQYFDTCEAMLERHGWERLAEIAPPPKLCSRCQAVVPFGGKRCSACERAWKSWIAGARNAINAGRAHPGRG